VKVPAGPNYADVKGLVRGLTLHTVCEEARCPNIGECWNQRTATFMLLGDTCTRSCGFCAIRTGRPSPVDEREPERVARAVQHLQLRYAVITSVNRDDQKDGGAHIFAETVRRIREYLPDCRVEVLIPDFKGDADALRTVLDARPDVLNHNVETVPRLFPYVQRQKQYGRMLELFRRSKAWAPDIPTKSGFMVGLGEEVEECLAMMRDLRAVDVDILTIGQYLRPSLNHLPIARYYAPEEFDHLREEGLAMGFAHVESGPFVRSSYHARQQEAAAQGRRVKEDEPLSATPILQ
jgi:lipoic acid synthetase